jgi:hypothetical protein
MRITKVWRMRMSEVKRVWWGLRFEVEVEGRRKEVEVRCDVQVRLRN